MFKYDPNQKTEEEIESSFINGIKYLEDILDDLKPRGKKTSNQCILITGSRGIGKSHFLRVLYFRIKKKKTLNRYYFPIAFPEELFRINSLYHLLKEIIKRILIQIKSINDTDIKKLESLRIKFEDLCNIQFDGSKKNISDEKKKIESDFFNIINSLHIITNKKYILLFENLQLLFGEKLSRDELKRLRGYLQENPETILIIASTVEIFNSVNKYGEPFYNFFSSKRLTGLDKNEVLLFLEKEASVRNNPEIIKKIEKYKSEIEVFRILTGGNPRLVLFLYDLLLEKEELFTSDILMKLTELTPYFKDKTQSLSPLKQTIIDELCIGIPTKTPSEISDNIKEPLRVVDQTLRRLKSNGIVRIVDLKTGNNIKNSETFYTVSDYFYRIWYQIRQSVTLDENISWMAELAVLLFKKEHLKQKINFCREEMKPIILKALHITENNIYMARLSNLKEMIKLENLYIDSDDNLNKMYKEKKWEKLLKLTSSMIDRKQNLYSAYCFSGLTFANLNKFKKAIICLKKAAEVRPDAHEAWHNMALIYYNKGEHDQAIKCSQKAIDIKPDFHEAWVNMGVAYYIKGDPDQAIKCFKEALEIKPNANFTLHNIGIAYSNKGEYNKAIDYFKEALKIKLDDDNVWFDMGSSYSSKGKYDQAIKCFKKVVKIKPDDHKAWNNLGVGFDRKGDHDQAIKCFKKTIDIKPDNYQAWNNMGASYIKKGFYDKAIKSLNNAIEIKKDDYQVLYNMGFSYEKKGEYKHAIDYYKKVIEIESGKYNAWFNMGASYFKIGNYNKAINHFQKALKIKPDYYDALGNIGQSYASKGDHDQAIKCYKEALEIKPDDYKAWYNMGFSYSKIGNYDKAIECQQKAIKIKPDLHQAWDSLGINYGEKNDYNKAIKCFNNAIDIKSDDYSTWNNLGVAYKEKGDYIKAINHFQKAIKIKPDDYQAWDNMGVAYSKKKNYDKAIECHQKAVELKPNFYKTWFNLGLDYYNKRNYDKAIKYYKKAIEIKNDDYISWYNLGNSYYLINDFKKALNSYKSFIKFTNYFPPFNIVAFRIIKKYCKKLYNEKKEIEKLADKKSSLKLKLTCIGHLICMDRFNGIENIANSVFKEVENLEKDEIPFNELKELYFYFMFETILRLIKESNENHPVISGKYFLKISYLCNSKYLSKKNIIEFITNYLKNIEKNKINKEDLYKILSEWQTTDVTIPESIFALIEALKNPNSRTAQVWYSDPLFQEITEMISSTRSIYETR